VGVFWKGQGLVSGSLSCWSNFLSLEVPVNRAYKELGLSYNTTFKIYRLIRKALYQESEKRDMMVWLCMDLGMKG